jgi:hypothetical protein
VPSAAYHQQWATSAQSAFDEIEGAHAAVGGTGPGRRTLTQINYSYVTLLSARFQAFCRALHTEAVPVIAALAPGQDVQIILNRLLTQKRALDRGNANQDNLGSDFGRFGFDFWSEMDAHHGLNAGRRAHLQNLNTWRNAIAHHDIDEKLALGVLQPDRITLHTCRRWRSALNGLALSADYVVAEQCVALGSLRPW